MTDIAVIIQSAQPRTAMYADYPHGASTGIPMYELAQSDLCAYSCVILPNAVDQHELLRCKDQLQAYLNQGGKLVLHGHVETVFLDILKPYQVSSEQGLAGLRVHPLGNHPIFAGVQGEDLTYRKGVAGFYGRGFNPPPVGAQVLTHLGTTQQLPIDWIYTYPSGGQLLVHAGNDLLSFAQSPSTQQLRTAFFDWAAGLTKAEPPSHVVTASWPAATLPESTPAGVAGPATVCFVHNGSYFHERTRHTAEFAPYLALQRHVNDLCAHDFSSADVLVVGSNTRADLMAAHRDAIAAFLAQGKTVVAMGSTGPEHWLPHVQWTDCPVNFWWWTEADADSGLRLQWPEHPLFQHITLADATWHQHGSFKVPAGARSLIDKVDHGSILYEDTTSTPGRLILTTLDPCYHHGSYFMPATTRFLRGFLPWLQQLTPRPSNTH